MRRFKFICWTILIITGLIQGWYTRHNVFSDGISYLEIARYYTEANWSAALNSYWSPLYSWILAAFMLLLRPTPYWEASLLHLVNFLAYVVCLIGLEQILTRLIKSSDRATQGTNLSELTIRITAYSTFLLSTLLLIDIAYNSPDMVGTSIFLLLTVLLVDIEAGRATPSTYARFGILLALEYLTRAAFASFVLLYLVLAAFLVYRRRGRRLAVRAALVVGVAAFVVAAPFVIALSFDKGRFTIGDAGRLNYGWELDGAARSIHWQGEPGDIGSPRHPTHKVFDNPAVYTFASPVPGSYPPWYDPSYWYSGISPHLNARSQLYVLKRGVLGVAYLLLRSPIVVPTFLLIFFMRWPRWFSVHGILAYWFLLIPSFAYIFAYTLVYLDSRYIAGNLLVVWLCLLFSISFQSATVRARANHAIQLCSLIFVVALVGSHLLHPALYALNDLVHWHESEWNLNWMIAERMKQEGLKPGDRIAWIGESINAQWVSLDGAKIVAEVPVKWIRQENTRFRRIAADRDDVKKFWYSSPQVKSEVLDLFRKQGVAFVIVDYLPDGVDTHSWNPVFAKETAHLPWSGIQLDSYSKMAYLHLTSSHD